MATKDWTPVNINRFFGCKVLRYDALRWSGGDLKKKKEEKKRKRKHPLIRQR